MTAFIILTNKTSLSNSIKEYFSSISPINFNIVRIFTYGLDKSSETELLKLFTNDFLKNEKFVNCFIFTDFGDSWNFGKMIQKKNSKIILCKGSLIETGLLSYKLINGGAPIESIMMSVNKMIKK